MSRCSHRPWFGRPSRAGRVGVAVVALLGVWSPRAAAAPVGAEGGSRAAESGLLAGFQLTSAMLHLVAGVPTRPARKSLPLGRSTDAPMTLLDLEARVWAGEEGLPPPPAEP